MWFLPYYADYFSTDRLFYSNTTNQWLGAPNAALFGLRNNHGQNNTVRRANCLMQITTHELMKTGCLQEHSTSPRISAHKRPSAAQVVIVTLGEPVYDAVAATLDYTVSFVPGLHNGSIVDFYRRAAKIPGFVKVGGTVQLPALYFSIYLCILGAGRDTPVVLQVIERVEGRAQLKDVALFIDNFQDTNLLNPNPVDNTVIPGGGCFSGGWGWANGCGGAWW